MLCSILLSLQGRACGQRGFLQKLPSQTGTERVPADPEITQGGIQQQADFNQSTYNMKAAGLQQPLIILPGELGNQGGGRQ